VVLSLAKQGLSRRAILNKKGHDETFYLAPLEENVATGMTHADRMLAAFNDEWAKMIAPVFHHAAF
jgi:glutamate--cysteine ligase